ncbi:pseudouridine synthase family protein [Actinidia rufa]|uniref:Pseudouridine synthase family protein n=1 Tax=Actinidia rufa TaxID=165716 RepID=A0A7J0GIA9_9ERIC|nr:pseudouridine synthase family protein [Actinidia rufa]
MLSLHSLCAAKTLYGSSSLSFFPPSPRSFSRDSRTFRACSGSAVASDSDESQHVRANFSGVLLDETVDIKSEKLRLDSWISSRIAGISRSRVRFRMFVKDGDKVECTISELQPLKAEPEDIPLDIVYEDGHVLVVNKPAHMVVHPAPGNATGTLVNDGSSGLIAASVRPGIVHRLDKGRVNIPIGRHMNNRIRMTAVSGLSKSRQARHAASRYRVIEILAGGGSALVEWRLETGRTHQIRAHAKYLGIPLLGDEVYGGTKKRPCLHALALRFKNPHTGESVNFSCLPPADFAETLSQLCEISSQKVLKVYYLTHLTEGAALV